MKPPRTRSQESPPDPRPDPLSTLAVLLADDLGEAVAPSDTVQEPEGIADVALARGIRPDQDGERPELKLGVLEALEAFQPQRGEHPVGSCGDNPHHSTHPAALPIS